MILFVICDQLPETGCKYLEKTKQNKTKKKAKKQKNKKQKTKTKQNKTSFNLPNQRKKEGFSTNW